MARKRPPFADGVIPSRRTLHGGEPHRARRDAAPCFFGYQNQPNPLAIIPARPSAEAIKLPKSKWKSERGDFHFEFIELIVDFVELIVDFVEPTVDFVEPGIHFSPEISKLDLLFVESRRDVLTYHFKPGHPSIELYDLDGHEDGSLWY
jgi:hypothetical protein